MYHIRSHLRIRPFRDHLSLDLKKHLEAGSREPRHGFPSILIVSAQITREVTPLLSELTLNINECVSPFAITNALGLRYLLRLRHVSFDIKIVEDNDCQHLQDWTHLVQTLTHIWSGRHNLKSLTISCEQLYWTDAICHLVGECLEDLQGFLWGFQPLKGIDHVSIKLKGGAYGKLPEELIVGLKEAMAGEEIERFDVLTKFSSR